MADEKKQDNKIVFEREYIVPLREGWLKVPKYKRAKKAVKTLKEFMVKHMKVYDRDLRKIKVDVYLNNEIRFKGMKKPLGKVRVKAIKYENGLVVVKLVQLPKHIEFNLARSARIEAENLKREEKKEVKAPEAKEENAEKQKDIKEKEESSKEAMQAIEKSKAKEMKHTSNLKKEPELQRKSLKK